MKNCFTLLFASCLLTFSNWPIHAQAVAQQYFTTGEQAYQSGNFKEAGSNFDQAIQLDPKYADAYLSRGELKEHLGDVDGALADYSQASELDPDHSRALTHRGWLKYHGKHDTDGAIADLNRALQVDRLDMEAYLTRGNAKLFKNDIAGGIADYTSVLQAGALSSTQLTEAYRWRGFAEYESTFLPSPPADLEKNALEDLQKSLDLNPDDQDYGHFYIWLLKAKTAAESDQATQDLSEYVRVRSGKDDDWQGQIGNYLIGNLSEPDFLKAIAQGPQNVAYVRQCEGYFYIGIKHLYAGDTAAASSYFQQSAKASSHGTETDFARFWLSRQNPPIIIP